MREVLFRGWYEGDLEMFPRWSYGDLTYDKNNIYRINGEGGGYSVAPKSVGQYVGIVDKAGRKIFEGDRLLVLEDWLGTVAYKNAEFVIKWRDTIDNEDDWESFEYVSSGYEVIGNEYEECLKHESTAS